MLKNGRIFIGKQNLRKQEQLAEDKQLMES